MSYNSLILNKLDADRYMANLLDQSLAGVQQQAVQQAHLIYSGVERLSWYSSCFMDNYQEVCTRLKQEDKRFLKALVVLVKHHDTIREMLEVYINYFFENLSEQRIRNITLTLSKAGAGFTTATFTKFTIAYTIATLAASSLSMQVSISSALTKWSTRGVAVAGIYGYAQLASQAAERLLHKHSRYYRDLYSRDLEMLYFLIEPIIDRVDVHNQYQKSDNDIVSDILRIVR
ncbi:TPA: hypothetical protein ACGHOQ_001013 [Salmonella enterica subsp. diarizonae serovar 61:l,v:z35]